MSLSNAFIAVRADSIPLKALEIDWSKCLFCQSDKEEKLSDPNLNSRGNLKEGYDSLSHRLLGFYKIGKVPFKLNVPDLNSGNGISENLSAHHAKWHKNCYAECSSSRLKREQMKLKRNYDNSEKENIDPSPVKTRRMPQIVCVFCNGCETDSREKCLLISLDKRSLSFVDESAKHLKDMKLIGRLASCMELYHHVDCFEAFKQRVQEHNLKLKSEVNKKHDMAMAELVTFINEVRVNCTNGAPIFYCNDLAARYTASLKEMGVTYEVHATRFKERILAACEDLEASGSAGKETIFTFKPDLDSTIRRLSSESFCQESEKRALMDAAALVRQYSFQHEPEETSGEMSVASQNNSTCKQLQMLVKMILVGNDSGKEDREVDLVVLTISQLLHYNMVKRRKNESSSRRHDRRREPPFPLYVGLKLYAETRKKELINVMHRLGISISYDRVQTILMDMSNRNLAYFREQGVVIPPALSKGVFTTAAADNLDHNPTSTFAKDAFHGTAITLTQHPLLRDVTVTEWSPMPSESLGKTLAKLPSEYSVVPTCELNVKFAKFDMPLPSTLEVHEGNVPLQGELQWLENACTEGALNWSAFHARTDRSTARLESVTGVLPLFKRSAHTTSMMLHAMTMAQKAIGHLNPSQVPVLVVDQPLFALCHSLQQLMPEALGGIFVMMGGLHLEMCFSSVLGEWAAGSGWKTLLVEAEIFSEGRADAVEKGSNVTRSRYAHEVSAAVLYALQKEAHDMCGDFVPFDVWRNERCKEVPLFAYWDTLLRLELTQLQFVRSIRMADYQLYCQTLAQMIPWFFALDHHLYARWASVHLRDLINLEKTHPGLEEEFRRGHFVGRNSNNEFSALALDQIHEQVNAKLKGSSGMIGLTENADSLLKWTLSGADVASVVDNFEAGFVEESSKCLHHRDTPAAREQFRKDFKSLREHFGAKGNPFLEEGREMYNLVSGQYIAKSVVDVILQVEQKGHDQYSKFVTERLENGTTPFHDSISLNKFPLMKVALKKKANNKVAALRNDCSLFSRLWIATQVRKGDMQEFFKHENSVYPPSLSLDGKLRNCDKSDIIHCLTKNSSQSVAASRPPVDAVLLDGAAIVHMVRPSATDKTFLDYIKTVEVHLQRELRSTYRLDLVFDVYLENSLKNGTREKRGEGVRTRVATGTKLPRQWPQFLQESQNKEELFNLVSEHLVALDWKDKVLVTTQSNNCLTNLKSGFSPSGLMPCNHEEADSRLMLHAQHAASHGCPRVMVRTSDSDVVVLAVWTSLKVTSLTELWVSYGVGKNHKFIAAHEICNTLGPEKCLSLPAFHAFTGCDTVSSFAGVGKKSMWQAWESSPDGTAGFIALSEGRVSDAVPCLEKFVITAYDRSSKLVSVNACREELFTRGRQLQSIPPTLDALQQHTRRAALQTAVWSSSLEPWQFLSSPKDFGWREENGIWQPVWRTLPEASKACRALIACKCKQPCLPARCSCKKATAQGLPCSSLCTCPCPKT